MRKFSKLARSARSHTYIFSLFSGSFQGVDNVMMGHDNTSSGGASSGIDPFFGLGGGGGKS